MIRALLPRNVVFVLVGSIILNFRLFAGNEGVIVAFAGLSGSGKTTMAKELAKELNATCVERLLALINQEFGEKSVNLVQED